LNPWAICMSAVDQDGNREEHAIKRATDPVTRSRAVSLGNLNTFPGIQDFNVQCPTQRFRVTPERVHLSPINVAVFNP